MEPEQELEPAAALASIPGRERLAGAPVARLGGLTNRVFRVGEGAEAVALRLPGRGTEAYIDRAAEAVNARAAAAAGVSPEVLHFGADGVMLTAYVPDAATMTPELFAARSGAVERAARAFRRLHTTAAPFAGRFELFAMIDEYLGHLDRLGASLPEGYHDVVAEAGPVRAALAARPAALAPCHCDPLCENFLDAGDRMWIVDWEYAGNNDPMWDLGDLSVEGGFDAGMDARLLAAYLDRAPTAAEAGRMTIYKAMCDLLWTLWGLIQHANGNPADDFWAYSLGRFERCRALMADPRFAEAVAAVAAGRD
ncbi:choline/ethanolamine kinase family protein [Amaricoccus sp.]|uniref:choline/ethanolamine kinase family protein n=1 Tax=Amaricoccus sp. TaxID=1872485 RepID=UPI001B6F230A|nr:choline/ethanolamine kinase family protein [Amaricoccus sp.]MBP7001076.1 phosphotransferase family protein [Amaricoccus sp.]